MTLFYVKVTRHLCFKNNIDLHHLDITAKQFFENPTKILFISELQAVMFFAIFEA